MKHKTIKSKSAQKRADKLNELERETHKEYLEAQSVAGKCSWNTVGIEWQYADWYATSTGKMKPVLIGIPRKAFWDRWNMFKDEIRSLRITLSRFERDSRGTWSKSKNWTCILWLDSQSHASELGFELKDLPVVDEANCPF